MFWIQVLIFAKWRKNPPRILLGFFVEPAAVCDNNSGVVRPGPISYPVVRRIYLNEPRQEIYLLQVQDEVL